MKKNNISRLVATLMMGSAITMVSCKPDTPVETVTPEFPQMTSHTVTPGSEVELSVTGNMDWTVSVPEESLQWYWIKDGSFKVDRISGKADEPAAVVIGVSTTEEFDVNRTCDVTMTMGGESKVIATLMRPAKDRTLNVFQAKVENGTFVLDQEGRYVYEETETSSLSLMWSETDSDFRMPFKVVSNCDWTIDAPSWLYFEEPDKTEGIIEIVFTAASLEDVSGKASFKVKGSDTVFKELEVSAPSCSQLNVFAALTEDGEFVFGEDGSYAYTEEPVDEITLVWPGQDYRMPVKVDAKCNWDIEMPRWLSAKYAEETVQNKAGILTFTLLGNPLYYPLEDTSDDVIFKFDGQVVKTLRVTIPGVRDKFSYGLNMNLTSWEFNAESELLTSVGYQQLAASAWLIGTKDACVAAVEMKDGKRISDAPQWIKIDVQTYVDGAEVLQQREITLTPEVNDGTERQACIIFCSKAYKAEEYFNSDGSLREDKKAYVVNLVQHGSDMDYVTMVYPESEMSAAGASFADNPNPRFDTWFGPTDYKYVLQYSNPYARDKAYMSLAKPYASYKVFNAARKDQTSDTDFWLKFSSDDVERKTGVVDMYMGMTPSTSKISGYIVFYDEDASVLAVVECIYDPEVVVEDIVVEFTEQSAQYAEMTRASLVKLTEGDIYELYNDGGTTVYQLTYRMEGMPLKIKLPANVKKHNVNPYTYQKFFRVNDCIYDEYFGPSGILGEVVLDDEGAVEIYMEKPDQYIQIGQIDLPENVYMAAINFVDMADGMVFVLVCVLDLSE